MKTSLLILMVLLCTAFHSYGQWTSSNLSEPKVSMGVATLGTKAYFAGGSSETEYLSRVEIYDVKTGKWSFGNLSFARSFPAGVSCGSKVFFAGGIRFPNEVYDIVDIYDTITQKWTVAHLSVAGFALSAVAKGNKVLFAGGGKIGSSSAVVDIYDMETGLWSTAELSKARGSMCAVVVGDLAIFAGGFDSQNYFNNVDIYNFTTNTWSTSTLPVARGFIGAASVGNKVLFAGGMTDINVTTASNRVDIYDTTTDSWTTSTLSIPRAFIGYTATMGNKAYFAGGGNFFFAGTDGHWITSRNTVDIYDHSTGTWSVDHLPNDLVNHCVTAVGNHLIVAGGVSFSKDATMGKVEIYSPTLIRVPADYAKIQLAIDAASDGDTVLVAENTWYENINFKGKAIVVASEFIMDRDTSHISKTVINGSRPLNLDIGSVVTFDSGEDTTSVLCGFTITGGTGTIERDTTIESYNWRLGGGVRIQNSGAKLVYNYIEGNTVSNTNIVVGGGILAGGPVNKIPWVVVRNNKVRNNKSLSLENSGEAGGIFNGYNLIMVDNEIVHNEANGASQSIGGGVFIYGGFGPIHVNVRNNLITNNKSVSVSNISTNTVGGGLCALKCSGIVSGNTISFNKIESSPGKWGEGVGVLIQEAIANDFVFENNLIANNFYVGEQSSGGGMELFNCGGIFRNNVIVDNQATNGGGITLNNNFGEPTVLINNTIIGNNATASGGGLRLADGKAVVINSIIWGNTAPSAPAISRSGSTLTVKYSDVQGSTVWSGEGNINQDPMFLGSGQNRYELSSGSPCIDKGIPDPSGINLSDCDKIGCQRIWGARVDMGAYEFGSFPLGIEEPIVAGKTISLMNYPNPFTTTTTFRFILEKSVHVTIRIFDSYGRLVAEPVNEFHPDGEQQVQWNAEELSAGVYFCRLKSGNQFITHKIVKM